MKDDQEVRGKQYNNKTNNTIFSGHFTRRQKFENPMITGNPKGKNEI